MFVSSRQGILRPSVYVRENANIEQNVNLNPRHREGQRVNFNLQAPPPPPPPPPPRVNFNLQAPPPPQLERRGILVPPSERRRSNKPNTSPPIRKNRKSRKNSPMLSPRANFIKHISKGLERIAEHDHGNKNANLIAEYIGIGGSFVISALILKMYYPDLFPSIGGNGNTTNNT